MVEGYESFPHFLKSEITTADEERERKLTDANRIHTKLNQIDYMRYLTDSMMVIRDH